MENKHLDQNGPKSTFVPVPDLADFYLSVGIKTSSEVSTVPPLLKETDFNSTVTNLPKKFGFPLSFRLN